MMKSVFLLLLYVNIIGGVWGDCPYQDLTPGDIVSGTVQYTPEETNYTSFCLTVDEDVFAARFILECSEADMDLYINAGEEILSYDNVDIFSAADTYGEEILITRFSEPPLETGEYYIDVVYQLPSPPPHGADNDIPFQIKVEMTRYRVEKELDPEKPVHSLLDPKEGMAKTFTVEVPDDVEVMRFDLFDSPGDVDFVVSAGDFPRSRKGSSLVAESYLGREHLVLGGGEGPPLVPGIHYITVFDQVNSGRPESFSLSASFAPFPPFFLMHIPDFPGSFEGLEAAVLPTVEIITEAGTGSGCIISRKGLVLTNWHVIEGLDGKVSNELYIGVSFSPASPPVELFRAVLVDADRDIDLALLRISEGLYGQPLPGEYGFPYFPISSGAKASLGDSLYIIGYPAMGGTGSRATITVTRGIVSGFERTYYGTLLKTDGEINTGSSGGACLNSDFSLIGLPTRIMEEDSGQLGYITPISMIPQSWHHLVLRENR